LTKRNVVEWTVLVVSVVAIGVLVAALVLTGLNENSPADLHVELKLDEAQTGQLGWTLPATVRNDGDVTAEAVVIEATATVDGEEESSEIEVAFLPAGSEDDVVFAFSAEPESDVTVRLVGYQFP
jgi:uncharacterized protein (TIGR02588 family)